MTPLEICTEAAEYQDCIWSSSLTFERMGLNCNEFHADVVTLCGEEELEPPVRPPVIGESGQDYIDLFPPSGGTGM